MSFEHLIPQAKKEERMEPDYLYRLKQLHFFKDFDVEELLAVHRCAVERSFRKGEIVIEEGTPGDSLYMIKKGKVAVEKKAGEEPVLIAELSAGECFGEVSLIDDYPHTATVRALEDSEFITIGRLDLNVLLQWNPLLASKMWYAFAAELSERIRNTDEKLIETIRSVDGRTAGLLSGGLMARVLGMVKKKM